MAFARESQGRHRHRYKWGWRWGGGPAGRRTHGARGARLCDLWPGEEAEVAFVDVHDMRELQKFMAMGILPGARIKLIQRIPVCVFRIGESEFAIDEGLSRTIYLKA